VKQKIVKLAVAFMAFAFPVSAYAQSCPNLPPADPYEQATFKNRTAAFTVPPEYKQIAAHEQTDLAIKTLSGKTVCFRTTYLYSTADYSLSEDKRFFSFSYVGDENFGHIVIDRMGDGQIIETGDVPIFNGDKSRMVALQKSESGWGSLEGLGIWDIGPEATKSIFFTNINYDFNNLRFAKRHVKGCAVIERLEEEKDATDPSKNPIFTLDFKDNIQWINGDEYQACVDDK
jgi:hypothetical protein